MKALTLTQPWATLVAEGTKRIETRGWSTPYRGPILIHAAKGYPAEAEDFAVALHHRQPRTLRTYPGDLPRGAFVARANLDTIIRTIAVVASAEELELGDYRPGRFAWFLSDIVPIDPPVPWRGALGLWEGPDL